MNVRAIPRAALGGYLKLVRFPLDTAIALLPGDGTGAGPAAELALDRADATVRGVVGTILGDPELVEDADRRRTAAEERRRALRLRAEAQRRTEEADSRLAERQESSERQRQQAEQRARSQREQAERRRQQRPAAPPRPRPSVARPAARQPRAWTTRSTIASASRACRRSTRRPTRCASARRR